MKASTRRYDYIDAFRSHAIITVDSNDDSAHLTIFLCCGDRFKDRYYPSFEKAYADLPRFGVSWIERPWEEKS